MAVSSDAPAGGSPEPKPPEPKPAGPKAGGAAVGGSRGQPLAPVRLGEHIDILPDQRLPHLDTPAGPAFVARHAKESSEFYALLCLNRVPVRQESFTTLSGLESQGMVRVTQWGVVEWPSERGHRFALVFDRPGGLPLMADLNEAITPFNEDRLARQVLPPVVSALKSLHARALIHGGVRPTNLFRREAGSGDGSALMLGECVSTPPGYGQPMLFETQERAMAQAIGRGNGAPADDFYALGVTVLTLLLGRNPIGTTEDEAVLSARIERGSFAALVGSQRLPSGGGTELVRGLLVDDEKQRWGMVQVEQWMEGRRQNPKQQIVSRRASRPLVIAGREYWDPRSVARALSAAGPEGARVIESGEVDVWIKRSISDEALGLAVQKAVAGAAGGAPTTQVDRLVSRVSMALDPSAPIRYRGRAVMPDAIGIALAEAALRKENFQAIAEILRGQLPVVWMDFQTEVKPQTVQIAQTLDSTRTLLDRLGPGFGVERVLYDLNRNLQCLSQAVESYCAMTLTELAAALDTLGAARGRPTEPMDRHIAAFIASRHRMIDEGLLVQLGVGVSPVRRILAIITILAEVQYRGSSQTLPRLCDWLVTLAKPAVDRIHNRPLQDKMRRDLESTARAGRINDLLKLIDNGDELRKDAGGFAEARKEYRKTQREIEKQRATMSNHDALVNGTGRQVASIAACVVSLVLVSGIVLGYLGR